MPSHKHKYEKTEKTKYDGFITVEEKYDSSYECPYNKKNNYDNYDLDNYNNRYGFNNDYGDNDYDNGNYTENCGSDNAHNNMPPYLAAFCWRRTS